MDTLDSMLISDDMCNEGGGEGRVCDAAGQRAENDEAELERAILNHPEDRRI